MTEVLGELGVEATATEEAALHPRGVALTLASTPEGQRLLVKVFGRDAWDGQLVAATWCAIWHRGAKRVRAGRLEQVEHEAFVTLAAERGGVPVMSVIAAGETDQGDALLVLDASARTLSSLDADEVGDDLLRDAKAKISNSFERRGPASKHTSANRFRAIRYTNVQSKQTLPRPTARAWNLTSRARTDSRGRVCEPYAFEAIRVALAVVELPSSPRVRPE